MAYRTRWKGRQSLTRKLRKLPEHAQREVKDALADSARIVQRDAVALVPVDTGNLKKILASPRAVRIRRKGLQVVFGITGVKAARDGFYARFVEFGTKGYRAGDKRRSGMENGRVKRTKIRRNIPARPEQSFMREAFNKNVLEIRRRIKIALSRALKRSAKR